MTTGELVELLEAILGDTSLDQVRQLPLEPFADLSNEHWLLLVRFLAGERPQTSPSRQPAPVGPVMAEASEASEDPPQPVDLGGVTLLG